MHYDVDMRGKGRYVQIKAAHEQMTARSFSGGIVGIKCPRFNEGVWQCVDMDDKQRKYLEDYVMEHSELNFKLGGMDFVYTEAPPEEYMFGVMGGYPREQRGR